MATFRRLTSNGATWFFTVATHMRRPVLDHPDALDALREAMRDVRSKHPFGIIAAVILPDHLHAIWRLPPGDAAYPLRWALIKRKTAQRVRHLEGGPVSESMRRRGEIGFWQRRYWEHRIRDERDLHRHIDYIHYNPVKHGLVAAASEWPHSTFHRYVAKSILPQDWGAGAVADGKFGEA